MAADADSPEERVVFLSGWSPEAAEAFVKVASDYGIALDYSPESLAQVERLIRDNFTGRFGRVKKEWHDLAGATGAYVTEVILRNLGGEWAWDKEWEVAGVSLPSGSFTAPLAKSRKRYEDGAGDDFVSYYEMLSSEAGS